MTVKTWHSCNTVNNNISIKTYIVSTNIALSSATLFYLNNFKPLTLMTKKKKQKKLAKHTIIRFPSSKLTSTYIFAKKNCWNTYYYLSKMCSLL